MSIASTMTPLMDKFREKTGLTDKLTVARATNLMDHFDLHINPNLLSQTSFTVDPKDWSGNLHYITVDVLGASLKPNTTYTLSFNSKANDNQIHQFRYRLFNFVINADAPKTIGDNATFESGKRQVITFTTTDSNDEKILLYPSTAQETPTWIATFYDCKLEYGDLATPLTKVWGITKLPLFAFLRGGARYAA